MQRVLETQWVFGHHSCCTVIFFSLRRCTGLQQRKQIIYNYHNEIKINTGSFWVYIMSQHALYVWLYNNNNSSEGLLFSISDHVTFCSIKPFIFLANRWSLALISLISLSCFRILIPDKAPWYLKEAFPRFVLTEGTWQWSVCLVL